MLTPVRKEDPLPVGYPAEPALPNDLPSRAFVADSIVRDARYEDVARRVIMGQDQTEIAADLAISTRTVRRMLTDPQMGDIYRRVHEEFYADLDKIIRDEKIEPLRRAHAQAIRAQTVVSEIIDEVRNRIVGGTAKATDLKVGADTAFGIIDRAKGDLSAVASARTSVHVRFDMTGDKKNLLRETIREAGIDLRDLGIIDAEIIPTKETDDDEAIPVLPTGDPAVAGG
jgi:hypothetical protein